MFRTLAKLVADPTLTNPTAVPDAATVFAVHPLQLSRWLEQVWGRRGIAAWPTTKAPDVPLGAPDVADRLRLPATLRDNRLQSGIRPVVPPTAPPPAFDEDPPPALGMDLVALPWEHMIYAYLVECTGVVEILGEIVRRFAMGETLDPPTVQTLAWARATEDLFFRDPPAFHISGAVSSLRPDSRVNRRNAYWRMFGMDLPHPVAGQSDAQAWKRDAGAGGANTRFLETWHELLRQVWLGIEHDRNAVGANPTDPNYVGYLCQTLAEMLRQRRRGGMLARDEFAYVCMLSWFHLTVEYDTPVVVDLKATAGAAGNPADRLAALGARVGITPPRGTRELFELAEILSVVLWCIERDEFTNSKDAPLLYSSFNGTNTVIPAVMMRIVDLWQSATGVRVKDLAVTVRGGAAPGPAPQPTRLPSAPLANGILARN
jgi:hypothetical protein